MSELDNEWLVMVDGAARGNPGHAGCGAVILDGNGTVVKELSRYLGHATNNVAEYEALLMGLEALFQLGKGQSHYCVSLRSIVSFMCLGK
jgi:ribonuclease HI